MQLSAADLHHLSVFMAARLIDWPCTEAAAQGCTALLRLVPTHAQSGLSALLASTSPKAAQAKAAPGMGCLAGGVGLA